MRAANQPYAWRDVDVLLVGFTTVIGMAAWIAAWVGVLHTGSLTRQTAWLNVGVAGLTAFGVGNALWLLRGRRAVGGRRVSIVRLEADALQQPVASPQRSVSSSIHGNKPTGLAAGNEADGVVRLPGSDLAHRVGCPLVAGKQVIAADLVGTRPCQVCAS